MIDEARESGGSEESARKSSMVEVEGYRNGARQWQR